MSTMPMAQPQNPNQAAGASMLPMSYAPPAGPMAAVAQPKIGTPLGMTGPGASTAGQPFGVPATSATLPINTNQPSISSGLNITDGSKTLTGDFKDTYGAGTGTALTGVLANLGTATNSAYQATAANVLQTANDQYSNILSQEAARGVSPDSSSHALTAGDFAAKVNANLADISGQMQLSGLSTIISSLQNEGQAHGPDTSGWDTFGDVLGTVGSIAGAVSSGFGIGGAAGSILDALSNI